MSRSDSGPWDLATDISHKSGNHLTNRHSQPPPTHSSAPSSPRLGETQSQVSCSTRCDPASPGGGGEVKTVICLSILTPKIQIFHPWLSIFPRGAARCQAGNSCRLLGSTRLLIRAGSSSPLSSPHSNRQIQTGSSAGRWALIPRNIPTVDRERECLTDFIVIY